MGQILYTKVIWGHIKSRSYMKHPLYCDEKNIRKIYPVTTPQNQLKDQSRLETGPSWDWSHHWTRDLMIK